MKSGRRTLAGFAIMRALSFLGAAAIIATLVSPAAVVAATPSKPRRIAVLVGANEAPSGRATLRYAHADARAMAETLVDVASFAPDDVRVLLDPKPEEVLRTLDAVLDALDGGEEALLFFYYSGHSDTGSLYPDGEALSLEELKRRLEDPRASVRLGVLDSCSGGAWTGAKGLQAAEPFVVDVPFTLGAEGSVLLAASSGSENAHEYERLGGSFFTHHLVAGLRGGAERNGDGVVSLDEAFEYAKAGTLRDSAIFAAAPQHPSFVKNLRGRSDLPLAQLSLAPTQVELRQREGPLQVIRLDRGLVVLETAPGPRRVSLALPPGDYLVRRRAGDRTYAAEVKVVEGRKLALAEDALAAREAPVLRTKAPEARPDLLRTSLPSGTWEAQLLVGNRFGGRVAVPDDAWAVPGLTVGLTDRVQLALLPYPQLAYRLGEENGVEFLFHLGLDGLIVSYEGLHGLFPTAGALVNVPLAGSAALLAGASVTSSAWLAEPIGPRHDIDYFEEWMLSLEGGFLLTPFDRVILSPSLRYDVDDGDLLRESDFAWTIGSSIGLRRGIRPLVQVDLGRGLYLDGHAAFVLEGPPPLEGTGKYGLGMSWVF
jgi:hypothetical protein